MKMDFKSFAKDAIEHVKDNAVSKIDANKKKNDLAKQKKSEYDNEQKYLRSIFKTTTTVGDIDIDEVNHLLKINNAEANIKKNSKMKSLSKGVLAMYTLGVSLAIEHAMKPTGAIFKFNEISDYELLENGTTVASGGLGRAIIGGALLGGAGAIVGGVTGQKKTKKIIDMLVLQISTTNIFFPNLMITYINKKIKNTDKKYISIINDIQNKGHKISAIKAALASYILLVAFLFVGDGLLNLFSVDISSFAVAGSLVIFVLAVEMIFGIPIFKNDGPSGTASIVPLVFPLIVGAGTLTTLLALRAEYHTINIIIALTLNIIVVYFVLKNVSLVEKVFGKGGVYILRKFLGIILLAISVKLFTSNLTSLIDIFK